MIETILVWVLVVAPSSSQNSPIVSPAVSDLESCMRMQKAIHGGSNRFAQCVQISVPVHTLTVVQRKK